MKTRNKKRFISLLLTLLILVLMTMPSMAVQAPVNLGTTSTFAILAGSTITNTGPTTINGDVGLHPGTVFTGQGTVTLNGTLRLTDAVALQAKNDLVTAYNDAAGRTPVTTIPTELGGTTLTPGVYNSADGTFQITGTLTLDAGGDPDGVFVFKTASTLITAAASNVNLIGSAKFCRIFWQVGSSVTLGTTSHFVGHILAMQSITANTGASVQGQLLARNGAVTLDTNTITNGICAAPPAPLINVTKTPAPLALTGSGLVTYTYVVTNPGVVALSSVSVTDDKVSPVSYVSGDGNNDKLLQPGETWIYTGTATLSATTTNTATATGSANSITVTHTAVATVVVTPPVVAPPPPTVSSPTIPVYPPLINVTKIPAPLALTGPGLVTYTYKVTNPGMVALSNVSVTDDKVSSVNYVSGDVNADNLLQPGETWIYTGTATLSATTTNTATATGSANNITATDIAFATVKVSPFIVYPPLINVTKTPAPLALSKPGPVTYTYKVTNPGMVALSNVSVTDDKVSSVNYVSGDVNGDNLLQPDETWIYTGTATLSATTTNTATATGSANNIIATDVAFATVIVTPPVVVTTTVTGGQLPQTSTRLYELFLIGAALILVGAVGWRIRKRYE